MLFLFPKIGSLNEMGISDCKCYVLRYYRTVGETKTYISVNNYINIANSAKQHMFKCQTSSRQRRGRTWEEERGEGGLGCTERTSSLPSPGHG